ncbi:MAG: hypothetical protein ACOYL5_05180 [Phototrophicaceae bacterium]|jgi:hypothetical protein
MIDSIYWQVPNRVLVVRFEGEISKPDAWYVVEDIYQTIEQHTHTPSVHVIYHALNAWMNEEEITLSFLYSLVKIHPRPRQLGWSIYVHSESTTAFRFVSESVTNLLHIRYRFIPTMSAANAFLHSVDSTLPRSESKVSSV